MKQLNSGGVRVVPTRRDRAALRYLSEQYVLRYDQLLRLLGELGPTGKPASASLGCRHRGRWETAHWLRQLAPSLPESLPRLCAGEPVQREYLWFYPTAEGLRFAGLPYQAGHPVKGQLAHYYWITEARHALERFYQTQGGVWIPERQLRYERDQGDGTGVVPDGLITLPGRNALAVEVQLADKSAEYFREKMRALLAQGYATLYYVPAHRSADGALSGELWERVTRIRAELVAGWSDSQQAAFRVLPLAKLAEH